ncbi:hypothetical protein [Furfurilactobacillus curtus]|uniref:Uncharacterized protein n=1 Tax=Furfurilactobacillus curtus TaxID=1746200 RepID=A0ABQ5JP97_9LACO
MDELSIATKQISDYLGMVVVAKELTQESVVLTSDEVDAEILGAMPISLLSGWVIVDMYESDIGDQSVMIYFIREASGVGDPIVEGCVVNNEKIIWTQILGKGENE